MRSLSLFIFLSITAFIFFGVNALALTCAESDSGTTLLSGQAPNGQPASLSGFELQDQDGMGTCFANTMSAMLEGTLPGHPHLSYQQIAVYHGVSVHQTTEGSGNGSGRGNAIYTDVFSGRRQTISEGGFLCSAFAAVKSRNALCTRDQVPLEREGQNQNSLIQGLAEFYDAYSGLNPAQRRSMRENLVDVIHATFQRGEHECLFPRVEPVPPVVTRRLQDRCIERHTLKLEIEANLTRLNAADTPETDPAVRELQRRKRQVERDLARLGTVAAIPLAPSSEGNANLARKVPKLRCTLIPELVRDVERRYYRSLESHGASRLQTALRDIEARHNLRGILIEGHDTSADLRQQYEGDLNYANETQCRQNQAAMAIANPQLLRNEFYNATNMCLSVDVFGGLGMAGTTLVGLNHGALPADSVLSTLARLDQNYDDFLLGAIGPQCLQQINTPPVPDTRPKIPADLSCNTTSFPVYVPTVIRADGEKDTVETARRTRARSEELFRSTIWNSLQINRPVGIDLCTAFFSSPTADTNYGTTCDPTQLHGYHAMTITGRRCVDGKMQYQLQNSWGPSCGYVVNPAGNPDGSIAHFYECNEAGGYIWVPEDVLLSNTRSVAALGAAPPPPVLSPEGLRNKR